MKTQCKVLMLLRNVNQHLQGIKSSLQTHSNLLTKAMPWIQASYILVVYFCALAKDRSMFLMLPVVFGAAASIFFLVRASLLRKRIATVILFPVAVIGLELVFHMSNSNFILFIIGTILFLMMLTHTYILSTTWLPTDRTTKNKFAYITVITLNTVLQTAACFFEYKKHVEPWVGPPLQKNRVILLFVLDILLTIWFLVRPQELNGKLCFLVNVMMNVAVTRNLAVTVVVTMISTIIFFFSKSPVYQIISTKIYASNGEEDTHPL